MQSHLPALHDEMWIVIEEGPIKIMKPSLSGGGLVKKPISEYTTNDRKRENLDNIVKDILFKMLEKMIFSKVNICKTTKEIWDKIILICEGSHQIKENKLSLAKKKFENFVMKKGKTIDKLDTRF